MKASTLTRAQRRPNIMCIDGIFSITIEQTERCQSNENEISTPKPLILHLTIKRLP